MELPGVVVQAVRARFAPGDAEAVLEWMTAVEQSTLGRSARGTARVLLAVVLLAEGRTEGVRHWLREVELDWRDVLVAAGLENEDWPAMLERAGLPVPPDPW